MRVNLKRGSMEATLVEEFRQVLTKIMTAVEAAAGGGASEALEDYKMALARLEELGERLAPEEKRMRHFVEKHGFSQALDELEARFPSAGPV